MNRRNILIIIGILAFIVIIGGISYSYFVYNKDIGNVTLNTGEISISLSGVNGNKTLTGVIPLSDNDGKTNSDYFDFTVNATVDTEKIYYEVYILPDSENTLDTSYLKTYVTDQNDVEIKGVRLYDSLMVSEKEDDGKVLYKGLIELDSNYATRNETKDFRLRLWLDENYNEPTSKTFEFDIYLYAKNVPEDFEIDGTSMVRKAIAAKEADTSVQCSNITYEEDGIIYLSGSNTCVDMNYVWYSGKLWRITAIYPDGAMKMVTENNITTIAFNASGDVNFYTNANTTSYMYQWLNEDFYDTLYHPSDFIDTNKQWNATQNSTINAKPSETTMVSSNIGLLNSYEYYNSYRCIGSTSNCSGTSVLESYLNNGFFWIILNPYDASNIWEVFYSGNAASYSPTFSAGVRPTIYVKSGIEFTGDGSIISPYRIVGDKATGVTNDLINTRLSGEYVKLQNGDNEQVFRIIGVEDNKTKIIAMDYADNNATKPFASTSGNLNSIWGSGTTAQEGKWYNYLTNTYYPNLLYVYGQLFDVSTYYMGQIGDNQSYKFGICSSDSESTKTCTKTSQQGDFNIGLSRYGEMFATPLNNGSSSGNIWLINRKNTSNIWMIWNDGSSAAGHVSYSYAARPTVHLKSTVIILSGSGTESDPYVVGLPS